MFCSKRKIPLKYIFYIEALKNDNFKKFMKIDIKICLIDTVQL